MQRSPCRPAARTSVFQAAERGCNSRHGCQRRSQLVQGSPSRFISADARVRFPQLRPSSALRSASGEATIASSKPALDPFVRANERGVRLPPLRPQNMFLGGELALVPGRSASPDCPQGPGSIPAPPAVRFTKTIEFGRYGGEAPRLSRVQVSTLNGAGFDSYTARDSSSSRDVAQERSACSGNTRPQVRFLSSRRSFSVHAVVARNATRFCEDRWWRFESSRRY